MMAIIFSPQLSTGRVEDWTANNATVLASSVTKPDDKISLLKSSKSGDTTNECKAVDWTYCIYSKSQSRVAIDGQEILSQDNQTNRWSLSSHAWRGKFRRELVWIAKPRML
jgi:hypothetical protein